MLRGPPCCTGRDRWRTGPYPVRGQAVRTCLGRPNSSMRLKAWTPTLTSVTRHPSVLERSPSPITCLNRPTAASAQARVVARGLLPAHPALLGDELHVAVPLRRRGLGRGA